MNESCKFILVIGTPDLKQHQLTFAIVYFHSNTAPALRLAGDSYLVPGLLAHSRASILIQAEIDSAGGNYAHRLDNSTVGGTWRCAKFFAHFLGTVT